MSYCLTQDGIAIATYIKIMPNARFREYLSKYKEVLNQIWSREFCGCNLLENIGCFIS